MMTPQSRARASLRSVRDVPEFDTSTLPARGPKAEVTNFCKDCRWAGPNARPGTFQCHRWPPVLNQSRPGDSHFPVVEAESYCGEFSQ